MSFSPNGVRWGLVFTMVLVGTVALSRGMGWYIDPARQTVAAFPVAPVPTSASARTPSTPPRPDPLPEELTLLASSDSSNQLRGADALMTRRLTPQLEAAVEAALQRQPTPEVEQRLVCLKSRFERDDTLDFVLSRFPRDRKALDWNTSPEIGCLLDVLVARAPDEPERVLDALLPAAYATNGATRTRALAAFRMLDLPEIPSLLLIEASTAGSPTRREALDAAVALGAMRMNPELIATAMRDRATRTRVRQELVVDPHPNAARIVANLSAESSDGDLVQLARDRETQMHDVSAALVEIALNQSAAERTRVTAVLRLGVLMEIGALHDLRALASTLEPGPFKATVDDVIATLREKQRTGARAQMRILPS